MAYDEVLADRVRELLEIESGVTEKAMFGGLAFLIDGHMVVAVSKEGGLMLRVPPDETDELLEHLHTSPMIMSGREARGWLRVAGAGIESRDELGDWVDRGVTHVRTLPPK